MFNRTAGILTGANAANVTTRPALGDLAFEGLALLPNGVLYYGDENRPLNGNPGGAYFKFIPSTPWPGGTAGNLAQSPLAAGSIFGLRLAKRNGNTDYGQGSNTGLGTWILDSVGVVRPALRRRRHRAQADRASTDPRTLEIDPVALAQGMVRWWGNNTGNEDGRFTIGAKSCA